MNGVNYNPIITVGHYECDDIPSTTSARTFLVDEITRGDQVFQHKFSNKSTRIVASQCFPDVDFNVRKIVRIAKAVIFPTKMLALTKYTEVKDNKAKISFAEVFTGIDSPKPYVSKTLGMELYLSVAKDMSYEVKNLTACYSLISISDRTEINELANSLRWNREKFKEIAGHVEYLTTQAREVLDAAGVEKTFKGFEKKCSDLKTQIEALEAKEIEKWCGPDLSKR